MAGPSYARTKLRCKSVSDEGMGNDNFEVFLDKRRVGYVYVSSGGWAVGYVDDDGCSWPLRSGWGGERTKRDAVEVLADHLRAKGMDV